MSGPRTRIAPTPSGYLHAGNAWSFLLTWLSARSMGGSIHLRIDDLDAARCRDEYVEDIFASLTWLGLDWDTGPRTVPEFKAKYSQRLRIPKYKSALDSLIGKESPNGPLVYVCACSRETVKRNMLAVGRPGIYPGTCRHAGIAFEKSSFRSPAYADGDSYPIRIRVPEAAEVSCLDLQSAALLLKTGSDMGDFVVWQKNGDPAYQLASLYDDEEYEMDLIVRGKDLLPSTGAQLWLASQLDFFVFPQARFLHHEMLLGPKNEKLSKSEDADSLKALRENLGAPKLLLQFFARRLGIQPERIEKAADLLTAFSPNKIPQVPILWSDFAREAEIG